MKRSHAGRVIALGLFFAVLFSLLNVGTVPSFADEETTKISLWLYPVGNFADAEVVSGLIGDFEKKYPNIEVDVDYLDYSSGDDQVEAAIENGTAPDVVFEGPERLVADWGARGKMVDISDLWTDEMKADLEQDAVSVENACKNRQGIYYEYPLCRTPHCMVINYDIFEKAGALKYIDEKTRTWSTENFIKACKTIRDAKLVEEPGVVYCGGQGGDQGTRALVSNLYGASFMDAGRTKYTIDSEEGIKALKTLKLLVDEHALRSDANTQAGDEITRFMQGKTAMCFQWNSSNAAGNVASFKPFAMTFPTDKEKPSLWGGIWGFGIFDNQSDERIRASKKLIHFLCDDPIEAKKAVADTGQFPVRASLGDVYEGTSQEEIHRPYADMMQYISYYNMGPVRWPAQRTAWWNMLQQVFYENDVEGALRKYDQIVNETGEAIVRAAPESENEMGHNVLFISSYSRSYPIVGDEIQGIDDVLSDNAYLYSEFMDSATINNEEYLSEFYTYLNTKYESVRIDAVIVDGDEALDLLILHQNGIFSEIPIIYTDINSPHLMSLADSLGMTGIASGNTITGNLDLAVRINPKASHILAISDGSLPGRALAAYLRGVRTRYSQTVDILNTSEMTREEILDRVSSADEKTILLYMLFSSDADDNAYHYDESIRMLTSQAATPVYTLFWMENGSVGGISIDYHAIGKMAGTMAQAFMDGASSTDVSSQAMANVTSTFDESVMNRYHIRRSQVPVRAKIENGDNSKRVRTMIYVLLAAMAVSVAVFVHLYRTEKERNLRSEDMLAHEGEILKVEAMVDKLTGIGNRRLFDQHLGSYIEDNRHFLLMICDIDSFKSINDQYGHYAGDVVLRKIGQQLIDISTESMVPFRYGGDEFAVLCTLDNRKNTDDIVENVRNRLHMTVIVENRPIHVTLSLGAASYPEDARDADELFKLADQALYKAKRNR